MGPFNNKKRRRSLADASEPKDAPGTRRVIETARTEDAINAAARAGLRPLVKPVVPSPKIHNSVAVVQDPKTGQIKVVGDCRAMPDGNRVVEWTSFYPYHFPRPFAAYLVPADLAVGEEVWLADVIEDIVAIYGNQGYHPRLESAVAIWNGSDFEICFDPRRDAEMWIG